ncbi:hypothetical protein AVEN_168148-1 [Araneus ventricosus]|uniref:Uncharacterized protein n=1 Tax=Araneus ventricosus TaxID=182803 RepID=A0A4Y2R626_ARAVE|nr:hypothetical protein AVEN_168148-1 [Araneus ventricosus]
MFWGFIALVIQPAEQRVVEYRPKTHTQLQLPLGTVVLRSLSNPLPLTLRSFTDVSPECCSHHTTLGLLEQGSFSVQSRTAILFKIFCWFRKPPERRKELHPFVQQGCGSCERWL